MASTLFIFGGKSTAVEMAELAALVYPDFNLVHVVGDGEPLEAQNWISLSDLPEAVGCVSRGDRFGIVSMARQDLRLERAAALVAVGLEPLTLVHPKAWVSPSAKLGAGTYVAAGARISANAVIGAHCVLNLNCTIGHDTVLGVHVSINPGAAVGGYSRIGCLSMIGSNSFVLQGVAVGEYCQVDAMTYVSADLPDRHVASVRSKRPLPRVDMPRS